MEGTLIPAEAAPVGAGRSPWLVVIHAVVRIIELVAAPVAAIILVALLLSTISGPDGAPTTATALLRAAWHGDFGFSTTTHELVSRSVITSSIETIEVIGTTVLLLIAICVPLGILSETHGHLRIVRVVSGVLQGASSLPLLIWGTILLLEARRWFGIALHGDEYPIATAAAAIAAIFLSDRLAGDVVQQVRLTTRDLLREPYMRTVRAAALGFRRHVIQSLVPSIAEVIAARAMFLVSAAIVAERVFEVRGLGYTVIDALDASQPDPKLVLAATIALTAIGLAFRLAHRAAVVVSGGGHAGADA